MLAEIQSEDNPVRRRADKDCGTFMGVIPGYELSSNKFPTQNMSLKSYGTMVNEVDWQKRMIW